MMNVAAVDTRLLGKPVRFTNKASEWAAWKFTTLNYLQLLDAGYPDDIERCMRAPGPIEVDPTDAPGDHARGRTLFAVTVSLLAPGAR